MNIPTIEFILVSFICYLCGVFSGCCWVTSNKDTFLQRARSHDDLSVYNHQNNMPPPEAIMATAPHISRITLK